MTAERPPRPTDDRPILVVRTVHGMRRVVGTCSRGERLGIRSGMALAEARSHVSAGASSPASTSARVVHGRRFEPGRPERAVRAERLERPERPERLDPAKRSNQHDQGPRPGIRREPDREFCRELCREFEHDPAAEGLALRRLAGWLLRFAPVVAVDPPDGLLADLSGCERLIEQRFDGLAPMIADLRDRLARAGLTARIGAATTIGAAWAVARFASHPLEGAETTHGISPIRGGFLIVPPGREREILGPLPIVALRIAPDCSAALAEVGVLRVDQLLQLDRSEIASRFASGSSRSASGSSRSGTHATNASLPSRSGDSTAPTDAGDVRRSDAARDWTEGEVLLSSARATASDADGEGNPLVRIDQALGLRPERLIPAAIVPGIRVERRFDGPVVAREAIERTVDDLIAGLCARLRSDERGVRHLRLEAERADASPIAIDLHLGRPTRRRAHLRTILRPHLETLPLGFGLDGMVLAAIRTGRLRHRQSDLLDVPSASHDDASPRRRRKDADARLGRAVRTSSAAGHRCIAPRLSDSVIECLDVLAGRLGSSAVRSFAGVDLGLAERFPEYAVPAERPDRGGGSGGRSGTKSGAQSWDTPAGRRACRGVVRPTVLFAAPEPIRVRWRRTGDAASIESVAIARDCAADRLIVRWLDPNCPLEFGAIDAIRWRGIEHRVHACSGFERVDEPWWWTCVGEWRRRHPASIGDSILSWRPTVRLHLRVRLASGLLLWLRCDPVRVAIDDPSERPRRCDGREDAFWWVLGAWS